MKIAIAGLACLIAALAAGPIFIRALSAEELSRDALTALANDMAVKVRNVPFHAVRPSDEARHIALSDGTRIALYFHFPEGFDRASAKAPVVYFETLYGHLQEASSVAIDLWREAGFIVIIGDARGFGASFGDQRMFDMTMERRDRKEVLEWIAEQSWSNGKIAVAGLSISGTYADSMTGSGVPAVKAAVIRASDFDNYNNMLPGGVPNTRMLNLVVELMQWHSGGPCLQDLPTCGQIGFQPIDGDEDFSLLQAAIKDHQANLAGSTFSNLVYRDDKVGSGTLVDFSAIGNLDAIRRDKVPARLDASWLDGTTADGALTRFTEASEVPMEVVIGATTHLGGLDADPFSRTAFEDARPDAKTQFKADIDFVERVFAGDTIGRSVRYVVLGTDVWKSTPMWPPAGISRRSFTLAPGKMTVDSATAGTIEYRVDPESTTGPLDRWASQKGSPIFYGDRRTSPGKRLEFTGEPMAEDTELVGTAELCLVMTTDQPDGLIIAYLEDVAPDGRVTYLTEGELRLLHRKTAGARCDPAPGTSRSFARADGAPVVPGETLTVELPFLTTAALIREGHSLRLSLAGADKDNFPTLTGDKLATWFVSYGGDSGSRVTLPMRAWSAQ